MTAPNAAEEALSTALGDVLDAIVLPVVQSWRAVTDAAKIEDDAELGRRVREIVRRWRKREGVTA